MTDTNKKELFLTARATVTIEYDHPSAWNMDCPADQVFNQGAREAESAIEKLLFSKEAEGRFRMVGKPEVTLVTGKRKKP